MSRNIYKISHTTFLMKRYDFVSSGISLFARYVNSIFGRSSVAKVLQFVSAKNQGYAGLADLEKRSKSFLNDLQVLF